MKINKKMQYGILLCLYLDRSGRTTMDNAAENLGVSKAFLDQIARNLRLSGLVKSTRGPGGGYELAGDPCVHEVFEALDPIRLISTKQATKYKYGPPEGRALQGYLRILARALGRANAVRVRSLNQLLVNFEMRIMDSAKQPECGAT